MDFEVETASPCATRLWQRAKEMSRVTLRPKSNLIGEADVNPLPFCFLVAYKGRVGVSR